MVLQSYQELKFFEASAVCIGNFDGLHRGHQKIMMTCLDSAKRNGLKSVFLTFEPHPVQILHPESKDFKRLLTHPERLEILKKNFPFDLLLFQKFDLNFASMTAEDFIQKVLKEKLQSQKIIVGENFRFGRKGSGDLSLLKSHSEFSIEETEKIKESESGSVLSSTQIREWLQREGDISRANAALGYEYFLSGEVVHGDHQGAALQFPTANLQMPDEKALPAPGVYASIYEDILSGKYFVSATNIGIRPTFDLKDSSLQTEAHLIGFSGDLYGRPARLFFFDRLREEMRFKNVEGLKSQISEDVKKVSEFFRDQKLMQGGGGLSLEKVDSLTQSFKPFKNFSF